MESRANPAPLAHESAMPATDPRDIDSIEAESAPAVVVPVYIGGQSTDDALLQPLGEAGLVVAQARLEAELIGNEARREASAVVAEAHAERDRVLGHVGSIVGLDRLRQDESALGAVHVVHSSEISAHTFRSTLRGLDPEAVGDWLVVVEASQAALEDELGRLRCGWDEMLIAAACVRVSTSAAAVRDQSGVVMANTIRFARPRAELVAWDTAHTRDALAGAVRGRRRSRAALTIATVHLARMQHGASLLQRSNEQLRTQLIETLVGGVAS